MMPGARIGPLLEALNPICSAGYALALHIKYTTPALLFQTYSRSWVDFYNQNGLLLQDPTVRWGFEHTGTTSWDQLGDIDTAGVLEKCAKYGMKYGAVVSIVEDGSRSIGGFSRSDRNFTADEVKQLENLLRKIHRHTEVSKTLTDEEMQELKEMSIILTHA
ncbi:MAG: transcriptional regulator [Rhodobacterales bacterium]|nr:MAG: transcriptional regulator [Rhodobacterales bacterium]